jgi:hypothetical protein
MTRHPGSKKNAQQKDRPKAVSIASFLPDRDIFPQLECSNVPRRYSSSVSAAGVVLNSVNAAFGYCSQRARSSAVIVSHPNVNMYRPGSVTHPTCAQVSLLTDTLRLERVR